MASTIHYQIPQILAEFAMDSEVKLANPYGGGHINRSYLVTTESGNKYILQQINGHTFKDIAGLMNNIILVTAYLRERAEDPREVLNLVPTRSGQSYLEINDEYWRVYDFVENSICLQQPESDSDFYESAVAFGAFQKKLAGFQVEQLKETIPNFHNTPDRYRQFREVLKADPLNRAKEVQREIDFVLAKEEEMGTLQQLRETGELPERVTHNDTKLNNVLLDKASRKALCVIDLDTVMPGLCLYDFGDSIRFGASTATEDETDLNKVQLNLDRYRIYTEGYVTASSDLTDVELELLPLGAKTMTLECGLRFLTDYLDGDKYFAIHRDGHNLDRARTQLKLVREMEDKWSKMHAVIRQQRKRA